MTSEQKENLMRMVNTDDRFNRHNRIYVTDVEEGRAVLEAALSENSLNSWGTPHGGLLFAVADVACGVAAASVRLEKCVTANASIDYIAATDGAGTLRATAHVLRAGRKLCFCAAEVRDEADTLLIRLNTTMYFTGRKLER